MIRPSREHIRRIRARRRATATAAVLLWLLAASPLGSVTKAPSAVTTVKPGGVVRWPGEGITGCSEGGRDWGPLAGACWFPIDLLREPGPVELSRFRRGARETVMVQIGPYPYPIQRLNVAPEMVDPPPDALGRIRTENRRVSGIWNLGEQPAFQLPLAPPLIPLPDARSFGVRRVFNGEPRSPHGGADFSAEIGTPVLAAAPGVVVIADEHYYSGKSVFIDHGDDLVTMYFHLDEILVAEGDRVWAGDAVGTVGETGRVTGPHLHFGVRWRASRIDPAVLLADPPELSTPAID